MSKDETQISDAVRKILIEEWDPLGVNEIPEAQDEYDHYVGGVRRLLEAGADKTKLVGHFRHLEEIDMGIPYRDDKTRECVAEMLLRLTPG